MVSHHCAAVDIFAPALVLLDISHIRASAKEGCRRINADEVAGLVAGAEAAAAAAREAFQTLRRTRLHNYKGTGSTGPRQLGHWRFSHVFQCFAQAWNKDMSMIHR